jgi:hypothetical protein
MSYHSYGRGLTLCADIPEASVSSIRYARAIMGHLFHPQCLRRILLEILHCHTRADSSTGNTKPFYLYLLISFVRFQHLFTLFSPLNALYHFALLRTPSHHIAPSPPPHYSTMAVLEPLEGGYYLWKYVPSIAAAVILALIFLVMTGSISYRMFKTKTWFCIPFAIGGFCTLCSNHPSISESIY